MTGSSVDFEGRNFVFLIGHLAQFGGAERQALILAGLLRERVGANVSFLGWSMTDGLMTEKLRKENIPMHVHPLDWDHRLTWRRARVAKAARLAGFVRFTRKYAKPDFLLPYVGENSKVAGLIWRRAGARYTWWNQRDEGRQIYGSRLDRWILDRMPDVVSNSFEGKKFLVEQLGVADERVRVINNAVIIPAVSDGSGWRERLGLKEDDKLLLMVANLTQYKDHATLLRAFAQLPSPPNGRGEYHLALAGRLDETTTTLKALAFDLGLARRVHLLGAVNEVDPLFEAADLVVHSSMTEGCPNAVLEGMAHGKCVVGTDISGMRQALGNDNTEHTFAPARNASHLARNIAFYLENDAARKSAGAANRERIIAEFSPDKLCNAVLQGITEHAIPA